MALGSSLLRTSGEIARGATAVKPVSAPQPEIHFLGEVVGGTGFGDAAICCKWSIECGDRWEWLDGDRAGQTHTIQPESDADLATWNHPIDLHYVAGTLHGWPRIVVNVWQQDQFGQLTFRGCGFMHLPSTPGVHDISCPIWRPVGTPAQEHASFFLGTTPALKSSAMIYTAASERVHITSTGEGRVLARVEVIARYLDAYGVDW